MCTVNGCSPCPRNHSCEGGTRAEAAPPPTFLPQWQPAGALYSVHVATFAASGAEAVAEGGVSPPS